MSEMKRLLAEQNSALQRDIAREARRAAVFERIAKQHLNIDTLSIRNSDRLDFHECGVWCIKSALEAAYEAGMKDHSNSA